ncbi:MAG: hypothetical protein KGJ56_07555 [Gammaproteobacteria bacterium]|nr:hypothetical protein [Gammaproteobacteria bacterium]
MAHKHKDIDDLYFRFLNLKRAVEDVTKLKTLDALEEEILNYIAKATLLGRTLNVTDLIHSDIASPVTVHKRLGNLKKLGYIHIEPVRGGYPAKAISLSEKAVRFFNELSSGLQSITR